MLPDRSVVLVLVALFPAVICWWSGRKLVALAFADDPIVPERMLANQRRNGIAFAIALASLAALAPRSLFWTGPLLILGTLVAAYPARRVIFGETWGLSGYLSFFTRLMAGMFGFWVVLVVAPLLVSLMGRAGWIVAVVIAVGLLLWNARTADVVRWCLRTRPMAPGDLLTTCRDLADRCGVPQPRLEIIPVDGGVIANAFALPSLRQGSVLFTETLLARLDRREVAAICAHELAHFEYYNERKLRQFNLVTIPLIVIGALWMPAWRVAGLDGSGWPMILWLTLVLAALLIRVKDKQPQETICDARAATLTGDPESLVNALTKLYAIARIPRRIEWHQEQHDTHPSLARRIRDIRRAAGTVLTGLGGTTTFTSADGGTEVTFELMALRWQGRDQVTHAVDYANLSELRIDVRRLGAPRLIARGRQRIGLQITLKPGDISDIQALLDTVDGRLGEAPAAPSVAHSFTRPMLTFLALMTVLYGQLAVAFVAVLACWRMLAPLLAGAGVAALTSAGLLLRDRSDVATQVMAATFALIGTILLLLAWFKRREPPTSVRPFVAALASVAALATGSLFISGSDVVRLHEAARTTPSATVLLMALCSVLACLRMRLSQWAAVVVIIAAAFTTVTASSAFLDRFGDDPFLVEAPRIRWHTLDKTAASEFVVPPTTSSIRLSPGGHAIAALTHSESEADRSAFHVGLLGKELAAVAADDLVFIDDEHILITESSVDGTTLRKLRLNSREAVWTQHVAVVLTPALTFHRRTGQWRLTGWDDRGAIYSANGIVGQSQVEMMRWPADVMADTWIDAVTTVGSDALVVETRYHPGILGGLVSPRWSWLSMLARPYRQESRYSVIGSRGRSPLGTSRLVAECEAGLLTNQALVCSVYDGTRSRFISLDHAGRVSGLGWVDGRFVKDRSDEQDWLIGWVGSTSTAIRLSTGQALRPAENDCCLGHLAIAGDRLAGVAFDGKAPKLRIYSILNR